MLLISISLREVPDRALRLVVISATDYGGASMVVEILVGPLPYVPYHIHYAERAGSAGVRIHVARRQRDASLIRNRRG